MTRVGLWRPAPAWARQAVLGMALAILPAVAIYPYIFVYSPAEAVARIYPGNSFAVMPEMGRRLAQVTMPDDRVFIFGAEAEVLFYAQRVSATRYIFLFPLYGPYRDAREKQIATADEIALSQPAAAVYLPNQLFFLPGNEQYFSQWSGLYLQKNFRADMYLTTDNAGVFRTIVPGAGGQMPAEAKGQQIIGALLVRSKAPG